MPSGAVIGILAVGLAVLWTGCASIVDEERFEARELAVYYGTSQPTQVPLGEGEIAAIGFLADPTGTVFCTATLIDPWVAVTASHCIYNIPDLDDVRFGLGHPHTPDALIRIHEAPWNETHDVALVLLWWDATALVPGLVPLPFNRQALGQDLVGTTVEAAGFGLTDDESYGLHFVVLPVTDVLEDEVVVNGFGERGLCYGDSGGPMLMEGPGGVPTVAAVESHGDQTCVGEDALARIDTVAGWIDDQLDTFEREYLDENGGDEDRPQAICSQAPSTANSPGGSWGLILAAVLLAGGLHRLRAPSRRARRRSLDLPVAP